MGFKVIESEEEFEAALAAGLLWINMSAQWPRSQEGWETCEWYEQKRACERWMEAKENSVARRRMSYLPEDFAVLIEDDACD